MAQLEIPIIDDALEERLRTRASRNGRSLEAEVCAILEEVGREEAGEQALREEGAPLLRTEEKGLGDLMYEHFKDRGLTNEEFARFKTGIFEINSRSAMRIPDFDADQFEETPSDKVIILDTNVVSELMRGGPHSAVRAWMNAQSRDSLLTTANTVMELRAGVEKLFASRRRHELEADIDWVLSDLVGNRVLS